MGLWKRLCSKSCFGKAISWPTAESLDVELAWGYCLCSRSPFPTAGMQREMWKWLGWRSEEARRVCVPGGITHFRLVCLASPFHCHSQKKKSKTPLTSCVPRLTYPPGADVRLFTMSKHWWKTSHLGWKMTSGWIQPTGELIICCLFVWPLSWCIAHSWQ